MADRSEALSLDLSFDIDTPSATVAVSGDIDLLTGPVLARVLHVLLEMQQNASRDSWSFEHTEVRLAQIMHNIHQVCYETAEEYGSPADLVKGANIVGFHRVARSMVALGLV